MSVIANSAPACCLASSTRASCSSDSADGWPSEKAATATAKSPRRLASSTSSVAWVRPPSVGTHVGARAVRRVAAQGEHVADPGLGVAVEDRLELLAGVARRR